MLSELFMSPRFLDPDMILSRIRGYTMHDSSWSKTNVLRCLQVWRCCTKAHTKWKFLPWRMPLYSISVRSTFSYTSHSTRPESPSKSLFGQWKIVPFLELMQWGHLIKQTQCNKKCDQGQKRIKSVPPQGNLLVVNTSPVIQFERWHRKTACTGTEKMLH